ncbi:uncharacterized protein E5676_scaffold37G00160 [Cucumis melo var. makuwa]|uniref:Uncharacterized protein n=1 Tax=Cucumis melo var. makuwa TaxID=1194695 RepID=A0A5D3BF03_CUCMM|nr:uncharacterized protein E6C27_scaffold21G003130 [Cucumis melo var. makuwa]TYJ97656.1 uncharacterized protein E5676_scaffold37G00160 [Cucumis melo var. makuwa]
MSEITWVSCDGHKRVVEYNELDQLIGESATKLKSFIGTIVRVHVSVSYQSWKDVPTELKDKIYELIVLVGNKGRERRKNNKYNHSLSRKGYANLVEEMKANKSSGGLTDCALLWKKARTTKDGEIPYTDTKKVANKIDNLLVSKHATHLMDNVTCDILSQAIGGNDPLGRIREVGQYVTPNKYFHTAREKQMKVSKEEDYAEERERMTAYDGNDHDVEEENKQILEEEVEIEDLTIEKQDKVGDENKDICASIGTLTKVKDGTCCPLAIRTKDNVVGVGTIFNYDIDGDNVNVSVDMVADGNCFVPVPTREEAKHVKFLELGSWKKACIFKGASIFEGVLEVGVFEESLYLQRSFNLRGWSLGKKFVSSKNLQSSRVFLKLESWKKVCVFKEASIFEGVLEVGVFEKSFWSLGRKLVSSKKLQSSRVFLKLESWKKVCVFKEASIFEGVLEVGVLEESLYL